MPSATGKPNTVIQGIQIRAQSAQEKETVSQSFQAQLRHLGLEKYAEVVSQPSSAPFVMFRLVEKLANDWSPGSDTTQLCERLKLNTESSSNDLEREILLAMLLSPVTFEFPSYDELTSSIRIRKHIVEAARRTALAFATSEAERPEDYWSYTEDQGFVVRPGKSLIEALQKATQPERSKTLYSFSCYRATEYVMALAVALEAAECNPELLARLQQQAETRAIKSGEFHRVFCREYGSRTSPLPIKYFVPGDRTWFRNPDSHSSDASGFEGSWVFYLGNNLFTNFWKRDRVFTLTTKCLEIFHWRHGTYMDNEGCLRMNEAEVEERVKASLANPQEVAEILEKMLRIYDPQGVYADGGCIDISREYPRWVRPETTDIILPDVSQHFATQN
jgi:hypothetical protein